MALIPEMPIKMVQTQSVCISLKHLHHASFSVRVSRKGFLFSPIVVKGKSLVIVLRL